MSYKIYTYADPYRISQTDFWEEIKNYPQLCASRTLVNGLINVMGADITSLLCPLDDIVEERIFKDWSNNISLRIRQYSELGRRYSQWHRVEQNPLSDNYYDAFTHNKNAMLDSIRLFVELGINADSLDARRLNMEQRVFVYLLLLLEKTDLFKLPEMPSVKELKNQFLLQAKYEKKEKERLHEGKSVDEYYKKDLEIIGRMIDSMIYWDGMHVVIHGIHQFTPLQLKFITHLDKLGVEIIFMYNYLPQFKEIYSSWHYIYQQFDAPIHHDQNVKAYIPDGQLQKTGNAIACNLALLCEENIPRSDKHIRDNYELYKDEKVLMFDNISEYAGYVSDLIADAESKLHEETAVRNMPLQNRKSTAAVLARMKDVIYTANKEVDELLQVYHPEFARNRHFLAYPIGQFFVALYGLWNAEKKEIKIDYNLLRDCVNSGIMSGYNAEQLLKTLTNLEPLFAHLTSFKEFKELFTKYKLLYSQVADATQGADVHSLCMLNIYNSYKVPLKAIEDLYKAICELNNDAVALFGDVGFDEQYQFEIHFRRLKDFINNRQNALASEEEKELISRLLIRLDSIEEQLKEENGRGTLEDLRSGLYFFLKQKEKPVSDWFVKNFEQIDGDVLNSRNQKAPGREKVYHFACVSDKDMNCKVNDLLPWPLSDLFIERAYNPKDLPFQVYYAALGERSNFMRYALFYGLYFSQCDTKISFVRRYGNDATDYYELLRLVGLKSENGIRKSGEDEYPMSVVVPGKKVQAIKYNREQMAAMMLCPYRFLLDYVLNREPIFSGTFLIQRYYANILIDNTWNSIQRMNPNIVKGRLSGIIDQESSKLERYFPFFRNTDIIDLKRQAENYILASSKMFNGQFDYSQSHMGLRKKFGMAKFYEELQKLPPKHIYDVFENLSVVEDGKKTYSTHSIPKAENKEFLECLLRYINDSEDNLERPGSWCVCCADKNICLNPYAEGRN